MMIRTKIIVINKLSVKRKKIIYFFITKYFFIKQQINEDKNISNGDKQTMYKIKKMYNFFY